MENRMRKYLGSIEKLGFERKRKNNSWQDYKSVVEWV